MTFVYGPRQRQVAELVVGEGWLAVNEAGRRGEVFLAGTDCHK